MAKASGGTRGGGARSVSSLGRTSQGYFKPADGHYDFESKSTMKAVTDVINNYNKGMDTRDPYYMTMSKPYFDESKGTDRFTISSKEFGTIAYVDSYDGATPGPSAGGVYKDSVAQKINQALSEETRKNSK